MNKLSIFIATFVAQILVLVGLVFVSPQALAYTCPPGSDRAGEVTNLSPEDAKSFCGEEASSSQSSGADACLGEGSTEDCQYETGRYEGKHQCGKGSKFVTTSFDFGCLGNDYEGEQLNPITDMMFAVVRFLTAGVGIVLVASMIVAGIQYTISRGNPQGTSAAIKRITNVFIALIVYLFIFAIANWLIPGGILF